MQHPQPGGSAGVVVVHIAAHVTEVDAEPDPRRLVAHGVDPPDRGPPGVGVAHVTAHQLCVRLQPRRGAVAVGHQRVEHDHLVAAGDEQVDDVGSDEPRSASDQDAA